jgi:hypothetical protein
LRRKIETLKARDQVLINPAVNKCLYTKHMGFCQDARLQMPKVKSTNWFSQSTTVFRIISCYNDFYWYWGDIGLHTVGNRSLDCHVLEIMAFSFE